MLIGVVERHCHWVHNAATTPRIARSNTQSSIVAATGIRPAQKTNKSAGANLLTFVYLGSPEEMKMRTGNFGLIYDFDIQPPP